MGKPEDRLEAAVDAAAHAFHDMSRDRFHPRWENLSVRLREEMKAFVRPLVVAALDAADRFDCAAGEDLGLFGFECGIGR